MGVNTQLVRFISSDQNMPKMNFVTLEAVFLKPTGNGEVVLT